MSLGFGLGKSSGSSLSGFLSSLLSSLLLANFFLHLSLMSFLSGLSSGDNWVWWVGLESAKVWLWFWVRDWISLTWHWLIDDGGKLSSNLIKGNSFLLLLL